MRYMMIVKATKASETGVMPTPEQFAQMGLYNQQLTDAGVLVDLSGLQPTSSGARIRFSGKDKTLEKGPFETQNTVSGYWIIDVNSPEEALEWAMKAPNPAFGGEGEIELRRFFEPADLTAAAAGQTS